MENSWQVGALYYGTQINGIEFWNQPAGVGTQVFPSSGQSAPFLNYPIVGLSFTFSPWIVPICQHLVKWYAIVQDYDYVNETPVQLLCCPSCFIVQRAVPFQPSEPISPSGGGGVLNPYNTPIIVG